MKTLREFIEECEELLEEIPANSAGSGNVDGIGVGEKGEPGFKKKDMVKYKKRNKKKKDDV